MIMYGLCWRIVAVITEIIRNTLNTMLYCKVQIEHQHFFIVPSCHSDVTTINVFQWATKSRVVSSVAAYPCVHNNPSQLVNSSVIEMLRIGFYTVMFTSTVNYRLLHVPELGLQSSLQLYSIIGKPFYITQKVLLYTSLTCRGSSHMNA